MASLKSDELDVAAWFKDELQCHICKNLLSNPRSLNCFHVFCLDCLEKQAYNLRQQSDGSNGKLNLSCPSCKDRTELDDWRSLSQLKTDQSITHLLESLQNLRLISQDGQSAGSIHSPGKAVSGQSMIPSEVTSVDSMELPSFVTSVGSCESSAMVSSVPLGELPAPSPQGNKKELLPSDPRTTTSSQASNDSIRSLRSSEYQYKSPIASNQFSLIQSDSHDFENASLAISSEGNTATTTSTTSDDKASLGLSSGHTISDHGSENEQANVMMERRCPLHPTDRLTSYCLTCKEAICERCEEEHQGHEIGDLEIEADLLRCELTTMIKEATEAICTIDEAQRTLRNQRISDNSLSNQLDLVEKQIKVNAQAMIEQIEEDKERLLAEVKRIREASSIEKLKALEKDMSTGRRIATKVKRRGDAVDVVNTSRTISKKMRKASSICASGGAIDRIRELSVRFSGNRARDLAVGQLQENIKWKLYHKFPIPFDKRGCMQGMVSLRNGLLAVGYETGGIDIFSTLEKQDRPLSRILEDVQLVDLASTSEDTIMVYPIYGEMTEVTVDGMERPTRFAAPSSKEHVSMSASIDGRIFLGYPEHGEIHQFQQSGGNALKSMSMDHCRPQQIDVTSSGKVVLKDRSGVKVLDPASGAVTDIFKVGRGQFAYSACDTNDHVYVAKVSASGRESKVSIDKYTIDGSLVECVSRDVQISRNRTGDYWLRLVSLSPFKLAACDGSFIFIYQRQPSAIELANDLEL